MANMMMYSLRLASISAAERWKAAPIQAIPRTGPANFRNLHKLGLVIPCRPRDLALCFTVRAVSSDIGDPERLSGDDFIPDSQFGYSGNVSGASSGGSESDGEPFSQNPGSLSAKLDATSQFSESVPSAPVEQLEDDGGDNRNVGPGGGGSSGGGGGGGNAGSDDQEGKNNKKLSASQKLTLAYAVLVGVGGVMGYAKSRSVKSLITGAVSTAILYYVYTQLPTNPVFASSLGLGISVLLLALMGARFTQSRKVFPAGIVSLVSLIMTGGYIHGIVRSSHT